MMYVFIFILSGFKYNLQPYTNLSSVPGVRITLMFLFLSDMEISRLWHQRFILILTPFIKIHNILQLAKAHPEESICLPPAKDHTYMYVMAPSSLPNGLRSQPLSPITWQQTMSFNDGNDSNPAQSEQNYSTVPSPSRLAREKNRLTLHSYLNSLLASLTIGSSPVLQHFCYQEPQLFLWRNWKTQNGGKKQIMPEKKEERGLSRKLLPVSMLYVVLLKILKVISWEKVCLTWSRIS